MGRASSSAKWSSTICVELEILFSLSLTSSVHLRLPVCTAPVEINDYKVHTLSKNHNQLFCSVSIIPGNSFVVISHNIISSIFSLLSKDIHAPQLSLSILTASVSQAGDFLLQQSRGEMIFVKGINK